MSEQHAIEGLELDESGAWVATLQCGHAIHLHHDPPWQVRPGVESAEGREQLIGTFVDCVFCAMPALPEGAEVYKETRWMDAASTPKGLLNQHSTKAGTWGRIVVERGHLVYVIDGEAEARFVLTSRNAGIIAPEELHHVEPGADCRFKVQFLRSERSTYSKWS